MAELLLKIDPYIASIITLITLITIISGYFYRNKRNGEIIVKLTESVSMLGTDFRLYKDKAIVSDENHRVLIESMDKRLTHHEEICREDKLEFQRNVEQKITDMHKKIDRAIARDNRIKNDNSN